MRHPAAWVVGYAALWFAIGLLPMAPTDLDLYFWPSAHTALAGHPLLIYAPGGHAANPNDNGPLALVLLVAVGAVLRALGWMQDPQLRRALVQAAFSVFIVLMAMGGVAAIERLRGGRLGPRSRRLTYAALLLAPPLWQSLQDYGHIEQALEVCLVLIAVRWVNRGWAGRAGVAFALAVLCRTAAVFLFIPMVIAAWRRGGRASARFAAAGAATGLGGLLPFYLKDPADMVHSLVTFRGNLLVGAGSIWSLLRGTPVEAVGQHWDVAFVAAAAVTANVWLATRHGGFTEGRQFAGLALTSAGFILLAKTVWPYYFIEAYVFATVWAVGRWRGPGSLGSVVAPSAALCGLGLIAEVGALPRLPAHLAALEAGAMFVLLAAWMLWVARAAGGRWSTELRQGGEGTPTASLSAGAGRLG